MNDEHGQGATLSLVQPDEEQKAAAAAGHAGVSALVQDLMRKHATGGEAPKGDAGDGGDGGAAPEEGGAGDGGAGGAAAAGDSSVHSFDELAKVAGISPEELFALPVLMKDGREPTTIGKLKDQALEFARVDEARTGLQRERENFEVESIQARREIGQIVELLGDKVTPELVQEAQRQAAQAAQHNHDQLVQIKPEWANPDVFTRAKADILAAAEPYGFSQADLANVMDYRLMLLLDHFAKLVSREKKADALAKRVGDDAQQRTNTRGRETTGARQTRERKQQDALTKRAQETKRPTDQRAAVSGLILKNLQRR